MTNPYIDQTIDKFKHKVVATEEKVYKSMESAFYQSDLNRTLYAELTSNNEWSFRIWDSRSRKHTCRKSLEQVTEALTSHDELVDAVKACVLSLSELIVGIATGEDTETEAAYQKGLTILAKLEGEDV